ncbi:DUF2461 domain-containing protein [Sphingobacterium sp. lm-10]|uniref:DUF2461 domain-containing protein n=1 Tax=Sphingobacterium sp. lm-10 TaxID=2944904 RepID=UPI002020068C|nr:DUF2461 domain-containing protein [Sphingobacterium sp. lm-10]MCL7988587.1 DUF2461 domain-containing protein [Sphingobacterium sp. lm-10]
MTTNIYPATFAFLSELAQHNNREWFQEHKARYDAAQQNMKDFVQAIIWRLSEVDPHIHQDINPAKCLFRIYRDVRFSKNKAPYKNWLAAGISVDGRKLDGPEYYIHIEPNKIFIAVGYWRPNKGHLDLIRQEIDYNGEEFHAALQKGGWSWTDLGTEDKLVRPPAGYEADHPHIDLLKLKSFTLHSELPQKTMESEGALDAVLKMYTACLPFKNYIHQAIDQ